MKTISALVFIAAAGLSTLAAAKPAQPLALAKTSGGFCANQCPVTTVIIQDNGAVIARTEITVPTPSVTQVQIATLGKTVISKVKKDIAAINQESLVDSQADAPSCADVPDKSFVVIKGADSIEIGREVNCHSYFLESYTGSELINVLKSFQEIYNYSRF